MLHWFAGNRILSHAHRQRSDHEIAIGWFVGRALQSFGQTEVILRQIFIFGLPFGIRLNFHQVTMMLIRHASVLFTDVMKFSFLIYRNN